MVKHKTFFLVQVIQTPHKKTADNSSNCTNNAVSTPYQGHKSYDLIICQLFFYRQSYDVIIISSQPFFYMQIQQSHPRLRMREKGTQSIIAKKNIE